MVYYSPADFDLDCRALAEKIPLGDYMGIFGIPKGGVPLAIRLSQLGGIPFVDQVTGPDILVVDDICDSGATRLRYRDNDFACIHWAGHTTFKPEWFARETGGEWIHYWWEGEQETASIEDAVVRLLQYIGEDPAREGLKDTPRRVIKSYDHLFSGYKKNPADLFTTFSADGYDEMVVLRDIEIYSMCEHHMLPFIGKAHVAYIPDKKIIGISKLARLVEVFSRRLQIQERIGAQVTGELMEYLEPKGAACIIDAQHLCMKMRGVEKQNSVMTTSSLTGIFLEKPAAREELMRLIRS